MASTTTGTPNSRSAIRAIPSTIVSRSAPSIPPASQSFEPFIKQALGARLTKLVFIPSAACVWGGTVLWLSWYEDAWFGQLISNVFSPTVFIYAMLIWASTVLPSVILKKLYSTADRQPTTSPSQTIKTALTKQSTLHSIIIYAASSIAVAVLHVMRAYSAEASDPKLAPFVKSRKHPFYLNGRLLFFLLSQVVLSFIFTFRGVLLDRFAIRQPSRPIPTLKTPFNLTDVVLTLVTVSILATASLFTSMTAFAVIRFSLPILYKVPLVPLAIKPLTYHFLRGPYTLTLPFRHVPLIARTWCLGVITLFSWEFSDLLFYNAIPQPISTTTTDPTAAISGISSTDPTFSRFAYYSLSEISSSSPASRAQIFSDQRYQPTLWTTLLRSCLITLGKDYQLLLRRGKPAPAPAPAPVSKPASAESMGTPKKPLRAAIFRDAKYTVPEKEEVVEEALSAVAADGPLSHAVDALPELFKSQSVAKLVPEPLKQVPSLPAPPSVSRIEATWKQLKARMLSAIPVPKPAQDGLAVVNEWWEKERLSRVVDACVQRREIDVLVITVLANLTCASLTEDRLGVVQRDIPKILEAFISHLVAVEEYRAEIQAWPVDQERIKSEEMLAELEDALKEGIGMIVRTFGEKLSAFKLPTRIAVKLETFVDYVA